MKITFSVVSEILREKPGNYHFFQLLSRRGLIKGVNLSFFALRVEKILNTNTMSNDKPPIRKQLFLQLWYYLCSLIFTIKMISFSETPKQISLLESNY